MALLKLKSGSMFLCFRIFPRGLTPQNIEPRRHRNLLKPTWTLYNYLRSTMYYHSQARQWTSRSDRWWTSDHHTVDPAMIPTHTVQEGGAPAPQRIQYDSSSLSHRIPPNSRWANRIIPEWNSISSLLRLAKHRHDHASSIHHYFIILFVYHLVLNPYQELSS